MNNRYYIKNEKTISYKMPLHYLINPDREQAFCESINTNVRFEIYPNMLAGEKHNPPQPLIERKCDEAIIAGELGDASYRPTDEYLFVTYINELMANARYDLARQKICAVEEYNPFVQRSNNFAFWRDFVRFGRYRLHVSLGMWNVAEKIIGDCHSSRHLFEIYNLAPLVGYKTRVLVGSVDADFIEEKGTEWVQLLYRHGMIREYLKIWVEYDLDDIENDLLTAVIDDPAVCTVDFAIFGTTIPSIRAVLIENADRLCPMTKELLSYFK